MQSEYVNDCAFHHTTTTKERNFSFSQASFQYIPYESVIKVIAQLSQGVLK